MTILQYNTFILVVRDLGMIFYYFILFYFILIHKELTHASQHFHIISMYTLYL